MNRFHNTIRPLSFVIAVAVVSLGIARPCPVAAQTPAGQVTVQGNGTVRIDGVQAATGATAYSGSRITTSSGAQGVVAAGGSRVVLNNDSDAIVSHAGSYMRTDLICGSATSTPSAGSPVELITHGDTSVYVQSGIVKVEAEGKTVELIGNQSQTFNGGVRITATGPAAFEASTILCSCLCAAPVVLPPIAGGGVPWWVYLIPLCVLCIPQIYPPDEPPLIVISTPRP